ncbi:tyrosine-type recombinase/integrase [Vibrio sp. 10N.222.52.C3]|uniref:tyrosine-type recombinase/integrase n=1 Tax=Vibrio sp. 10N.222.52.C3 TaxID=3229631 RepID=UPI003551B57F
MQVKLHIYQIGGKTRVSLVNSSYLPDYSLCNHLYQSYGNDAINTQISVAHDLRFFFEWLDHEGIDIEQRISTGEMLQAEEVRRFTQSTKFTFKGITDHKEVASFRLSNKAINNLIHSTKTVSSIVVPPTTNNRIRRSLAFLEYLYLEHHSTGHVPTYIEKRFSDMKSVMLLGIRRDTELRTLNGDPEISVIPDKAFYKLLDIIQPNHPSNPFKHSQWRNALIVLLLAQVGERKGAILKLKISDCDFTGTCTKIYVRRTPNDLTDPRKDKPSQKTREHTAYVDKETMLELKSYIANKRKTYIGAERHEFVFISEMATQGESGDPLSISSVNYILRRLSEVIGFQVTPHKLRHKWNELLDDIKDGDESVSPDYLEKVRKYQMGWSENSQMPALYNRYKIIKKAQGYQYQLQEKLLSVTSHDS